MSRRQHSEAMDDFLMCAGFALILLALLSPVIVYIVVSA